MVIEMVFRRKEKKYYKIVRCKKNLMLKIRMLSLVLVNICIVKFYF